MTETEKKDEAFRITLKRTEWMWRNMAKTLLLFSKMLQINISSTGETQLSFRFQIKFSKFADYF